VAFGSLTGMIVEGDVGRMIGSRKLETRIRRLSGHAIVCGFGRMGRRLVELLIERDVPMVIVEADQSAARHIEQLKQLYILGDATDEQILMQAGLERAKWLVAVLRNDADNVFVTLTARELRPDMVIVTRAEQLSSQAKLKRAGANRVISPQEIGAERIVDVMTQPHLVDFVDVAAKGVELEMDAFVVGEDSPFAGKTLKEADLRRIANVMVIAIKGADGTMRFNPQADEKICPSDTLIIIGETGSSKRLREMQLGKHTSIDPL
jgi:voltage-gated potassium channel